MAEFNQLGPLFNQPLAVALSVDLCRRRRGGGKGGGATLLGFPSTIWSALSNFTSSPTCHLVLLVSLLIIPGGLTFMFLIPYTLLICCNLYQQQRELLKRVLLKKKKIDSSLFPDKENGIAEQARLAFTSSIWRSNEKLFCQLLQL